MLSQLILINCMSRCLSHTVQMFVASLLTLVCVDRQHFQQAGYCFVEFADRDTARRAMLHINGKTIPKSKPTAAFNLSFANSPTAPFLVNVTNHAVVQRCIGTRMELRRLEMNKYRVGGKQLLLKLAQPKYRAPKTPRYLQQQQAPACETMGYYASTQDNRAVAQVAPPVSSSSYYQYSATPVTSSQSSPYAAQQYGSTADSRATQNNYEQCYRKVVGGAVVSCEANGVEPVSDETADENNEKVLDNSEEFYEALEQSRWSKVVFSADMHENDLLKALS
ncbi:unnamed protein product [Gongylonema pulchrum]|uniref:RRM domain-containing protein n=1 Tax=Gongylonema pulchrum TaxID=637853 RepID=A0A183DSN0_9BILA|nr:unnamed protein product [Gongylonema pulchrum]